MHHTHFHQRFPFESKEILHLFCTSPLPELVLAPRLETTDVALQIVLVLLVLEESSPQGCLVVAKVALPVAVHHDAVLVHGLLHLGDEPAHDADAVASGQFSQKSVFVIAAPSLNNKWKYCGIDLSRAKFRGALMRDSIVGIILLPAHYFGKSGNDVDLTIDIEE